MPTPSSGAISLLDVANEFGGSTPHAINEYYGVAAGVPTSGIISLNDFYGKSGVAQPGIYEIRNLSLTSDNSWVGQSFYTLSETGELKRPFRIVFRYQNGNTGNSFGGDFQIHSMFALDQGTNRIFYEDFEANSGSFETSTGVTVSGDYFQVPNWATIPNTSSSSNFKWNRRTGSTPSTNTGVTVSFGSQQYYMYAETSGGGTLSRYYWMRSPIITWDYVNSLENIGIFYGAYGNNIGSSIISCLIEVLP